MQPILTAKQMQLADRATIDAGTPSSVLMERAARAALELLLNSFDTSGAVLILCGPGNNGGDGFVLARLLGSIGKRAVICYPGKMNNGIPDIFAMSADAAAEFSRLPKEVPVLSSPEFSGVSAVVDAMFGVGLSREITGRFADATEALNASGIPVLSIDLPTGIHADTGAVLGHAVRAGATLAISHLKRGHILYPGYAYCGQLHTADIGITAPFPKCLLLEKEDLHALPLRPAYSNKGSFGRVLVVGGSVGMSGAGFFCAKSAYRAGAGLVELFAPARNRSIYQRQLPEAVLTLYPEKTPERTLLDERLTRARAVAVGMGLSGSDTAKRLTEWVLCDTPTELPLIIDADALNILSEAPALWERIRTRKQKAILTPHLGEMSRLCKKPIPEIAGDLIGTAVSFAAEHNVILVLKDAHTVITDGSEIYLNTCGNNGMATGGSGDVLAGVISGFAASGTDPFLAARLGVLAHALAGDLVASERGVRGLMAGDLPDALCRVLKDIS